MQATQSQPWRRDHDFSESLKTSGKFLAEAQPSRSLHARCSRLTSLETCVCVVLKRAATSFCFSPFSHAARIDSTSASESFARPFRLPKTRRSPALPRLFMSCMFCCCVPSYRCFGLQHPRLSHVCSTYDFAGAPFDSSNALRCAYTCSCPTAVCP